MEQTLYDGVWRCSTIIPLCGGSNMKRNHLILRTRPPRLGARAFSLVELVIVVVIIGIVAAIAVPRISSGATSASANALEATITNVRKAIDIYYAEHGSYPGYNPSDGSPDGTRFQNQLLMYSDDKGNTNVGRTAAYRFGPYLRAPFPKNPSNKLDSVHVKATEAAPSPADGSVGWVAVLSNGDFGISATSADLDRLGIVKASAKLDVAVK